MEQPPYNLAHLCGVDLINSVAGLEVAFEDEEFPVKSSHSKIRRSARCQTVFKCQLQTPVNLKMMLKHHCSTFSGFRSQDSKPAPGISKPWTVNTASRKFFQSYLRL